MFTYPIYVAQTSSRGRGASALGVGAGVTRPPLGEIRRRADASPSGPTSPKVPGHVGDCVCLKPLVTILPVPYHRQLKNKTRKERKEYKNGLHKTKLLIVAIYIGQAFLNFQDRRVIIAG